MIAHLLSAMFFMRGKVWLRGLFLYVGGFVFRRPLSNCLTLRRLRGGVGIRVSGLRGGGVFPANSDASPPPKNSLARIFTPPRKRRRVKVGGGLKKVSGCLKTILSASYCPQENR